MLKRLFAPRPRPPVIPEEVLSICRKKQAETLGLSPHLRRDIGLDCGCLIH